MKKPPNRKASLNYIDNRTEVVLHEFFSHGGVALLILIVALIILILIVRPLSFDVMAYS